MTKKSKNLIVFFNASVILAGLKSPKGGSAKLLSWSGQNKIEGIVSELILDEAGRNLKKLFLSKRTLKNKISAFKIRLAPKVSLVNKYKRRVIDYGDAHVFASAEEAEADYLVSLDKKHILVLKHKIRKIKIVSPKELIEDLSK